jgi:hypothetical protein
MQTVGAMLYFIVPDDVYETERISFTTQPHSHSEIQAPFQQPQQQFSSQHQRVVHQPMPQLPRKSSANSGFNHVEMSHYNQQQQQVNIQNPFETPDSVDERVIFSTAPIGYSEAPYHPLQAQHHHYQDAQPQQQQQFQPMMTEELVMSHDTVPDVWMLAQSAHDGPEFHPQQQQHQSQHYNANHNMNTNNSFYMPHGYSEQVELEPITYQRFVTFPHDGAILAP